MSHDLGYLTTRKEELDKVHSFLWNPYPQSSLEEEGQAWRHGESWMDQEVGMTPSQWVVLESTQPGELGVGWVD